jgi:hypothetical protein
MAKIDSSEYHPIHFVTKNGELIGVCVEDNSDDERIYAHINEVEVAMGDVIAYNLGAMEHIDYGRLDLNDRNTTKAFRRKLAETPLTNN